ncbi:hypothetical protein [Cytobacillus dafuensis]|uniref:Lipoprotein n=1 Tax=Cytobacillus dafuensis TaxID=1742359 RepID=A0A5B8Z691_CYTDA|nr:hypothetical protein [Cytobacillus dafuensis]QED46906.1 hypothetical protein FSZ17_06285 [Cytobacillus dafuensis]
MKRFLPGVVFLLAAGILASCTNQTNADPTKEITELKKQIEQLSSENDALKNTVEEQKKTLEETTNNDNSVIPAKDIEKYPQSLYKQTKLDIDQDGEDEIIELYVNAGKGENGVFAWDDGQTWLLVVKDGEKTYPLFDEYVQLGSIDFSTTTFDEKPGIVMLKMQHSDKSIYKFVYDQNAKGFVKETLYKKENINDHYNPPASYAFFKDAYELMEQAFTEKAVKALEASENDLQDIQDRAAIFDPILFNLWNAQRLFETTRELNPQLSVSLGSTIEWLNQMFKNTPTEGQMNQLRNINDVFKENDSDDLIIEEENQIHPDIQEKLQRMDLILNGEK